MLACYESATPIADASTSPFDTRIAGQWRCVAAEADEPELFSITAVGFTQYDVVMGNADEKPSLFHVHSARLGGAAVANVQEAGEARRAGKWVLARYTLFRPSVLEIEIGSERALKDAGEGAALRDRAKLRLKAGDLFDQFCVCVRVKAAASAPATSAAPAPCPSPGCPENR
jgi:hypothetical protein